MVKPSEMGPKLYRYIWKYHDDDWGAAVGGIMAGQGSAKTACCLDIAEKKMKVHPKEKIFWHDTVGSPCQFRKAKFFPYKIFVEKGVNIEFYDITHDKTVHPHITFFSDVEELCDLAEYQTINVVYFDSRKSWTDYNRKSYGCTYDDPQAETKNGLLAHLMSGNKVGNQWQTIIVDEMESLFDADVNNQTDEKWWDWTTKASTSLVKECRKCRVGLLGNYHSHDSIHHKIRGKFMYHLWGLGSIPRGTRVNQKMVDQCELGEFCIDHEGSKFGKIKIKTVYDPPQTRWVARYKHKQESTI